MDEMPTGEMRSIKVGRNTQWWDEKVQQWEETHKGEVRCSGWTRYSRWDEVLRMG